MPVAGNRKKIVIRRITANEGALLRRLRIAALTEAPYAFGARLDDTLAEPLASFDATAARHASSATSTTFIAFVGGEAVGLIGAFEAVLPPERCFICSLWLEPAHRGTGIAAQLVHTASAWLCQRSGQDVFAWVADANRRALAFYQKIGFVATDEHLPLPSNPAETETLFRLKPVIESSLPATELLK